MNTTTRKQITVGGVPIGGGAPVVVQSMTSTKTGDIPATVAQIHRLEAAGCELIRLAVPDLAAAHALAQIKEQIHIPLVADIHFDYRLALESAAAGADGIRINPGNIGDDDRVRQVAAACTGRGLPIRIGVNGGSLERDIVAKFGHTPEAMVESALYHTALLNRFDFDDICLSVKSSSVPDTVAAYRLLHSRTSYPLHLGVTEAGTAYMGTVKSAIGIGSLLLDGIGDTIRVSLTDDPAEEIKAARAILQSLGLRRFGPNIVSCPTCGRCNIDLIPLAREVEQRLADSTREITVAVMGCAVNGPGEASAADFGIAGGAGEGLLFRHGETVGKVPMDRLVDALMEMIAQ
ncbi:MAG: flavodoxin-dependent (E)-4-hydroxy-3-methylbut-2-enyl-diphosphate synthase [Oscillospiraceae bacterium]|nr:flavodoxin-dependent (E)-4-hydroxy-3-methylbut-2-enyl-diphosphate synthase [Oscillospiraceae bacterium]